MTDGWAITAALATAASAAVVAYQAFYTRRSVRDTGAALKLAQQEFERGEALRVQAERARIDAEMPRLTVEVREGYEGPNGVPSGGTVLDEVTGQYRPQEDLGVLIMPRDGGLLLEVTFTVVVLNDGPRTAALSYSTPLVTGDGPKTHRIVLRPGTSQNVPVSVVRPLGRWVDIARSYREGGSPVEYDSGAGDLAFVLSYVYPGDSSAVEEHRVLVGGSVVAPVAGNDAGWTPRVYSPWDIYGQFAAVAQPFTRRYWSSRLREQDL